VKKRNAGRQRALLGRACLFFLEESNPTEKFQGGKGRPYFLLGGGAPSHKLHQLPSCLAAQNSGKRGRYEFVKRFHIENETNLTTFFVSGGGYCRHRKRNKKGNRIPSLFPGKWGKRDWQGGGDAQCVHLPRAKGVLGRKKKTQRGSHKRRSGSGHVQN